MIVRILGEGQFEVDASHLDELNGLDEAVERTLDGDDDSAFSDALAALLDAVRTWGSAVPDEDLAVADFILPPSDASVEEVREMLSDEGLIPDAV